MLASCSLVHSLQAGSCSHGRRGRPSFWLRVSPVVRWRAEANEYASSNIPPLFLNGAAVCLFPHPHRLGFPTPPSLSFRKPPPRARERARSCGVSTPRANAPRYGQGFRLERRPYDRADLPVNSRTAAVGILLQRRLEVEPPEVLE